jgi:hypothetical protein
MMGATEPTASEDVAHILAAWAQIPVNLRERLLANGRVLEGCGSGLIASIQHASPLTAQHAVSQGGRQACPRRGPCGGWEGRLAQRPD